MAPITLDNVPISQNPVCRRMVQRPTPSQAFLYITLLIAVLPLLSLGDELPELGDWDRTAPVDRGDRRHVQL